MSCIDEKFSIIKSENRSALIVYIMAGYPDYKTSLSIMEKLPEIGVDIIELGIPFSDPVADGTIIQKSSFLSISKGQTLEKTLNMVYNFRQKNKTTPVVLMGYYNPIYVYGVKNFLKQSKISGVNGILVVDLPFEMDEELCIPSMEYDISFIRLVTPTTDIKRLNKILQKSSGFIYYVSTNGITGQNFNNNIEKISCSIKRIKKYTKLPVVIGFGIKNSEQVKKLAKISDGIVIGTAIIEKISSITIPEKEEIKNENFQDIESFISQCRLYL